MPARSLRAHPSPPRHLIFPTALVNGDNVLAVEVHQSSTTSSDDVFGMALSGIKSQTNIVIQGVVLNEVLARNLSVPVPGTTNLTDWAELYNPSSRSLDLAGMSLSDQLANPRRWVFPAGVALAAGGYLVVQFDPNSPASSNTVGVLNTGFGLDATEGDSVYLFDTPAQAGALLSAVTFGIQAADFSIARLPNGGDTWNLALPTPGGPQRGGGDGQSVRARGMSDGDPAVTHFSNSQHRSQPISWAACI
jgi:hypothetical protein